jgi:hypothetical protein
MKVTGGHLRLQGHEDQQVPGRNQQAGTTDDNEAVEGWVFT